MERPNVYPLPHMDDKFDRIAGAQYFSSLIFGYEGRHMKTAFVTPAKMNSLRKFKVSNIQLLRVFLILA
jgi:hypothetical protein